MTAAPRAVVVYVSGHGYGHAVRTALVIEQLRAQQPDVRIQVRSLTPGWIYPPEVELVSQPVDIGLLQSDSLTPLFDETLTAALAFERARGRLADAEARVLASQEPAVIVADIPPLAFEVAYRLGAPGVAIGNFSWDWIYASLGSHRADVAELVSSIRASEARADLLLRLPMSGDLSAFPHIEDIPLIARVSEVDRVETRRRVGIPLDRPAVLLSFGGFELARLDFRALEKLRQYTFVTTLSVEQELPPNVVVCPREAKGYHHLLASCDVAIMKPGFATVSDCLANRVPMIYTRRPGYCEEDVLVAAMHERGTAIEVSQEAVLAGDLAQPIEAALVSPTRWAPVRLDGAVVAARRILEVAGATSRGQ